MKIGMAGRFARFRLLALCLYLFAAWPAAAGDRVALLVGNSAYPGKASEGGEWARLPNAEHDVDLVGAALAKAGFEVIKVRDGKVEDINAAVDRFVVLSEQASVSVFYYSGHGFEYRRRNFIVPVDAPINITHDELWNSYVDFEELAGKISNARLNVFFIDACRTAKEVVRLEEGATQGPVVANAINDIDFPDETDVAILYATKRGRPAYDSAPPPEEYSPFAWEVAQLIGKPRIDLGYLFQTVSYGVAKRTEDFLPRQQPYFYGSMPPDSYINDTPAKPAVDPGGPGGEPIRISSKELATIDEPILIVRLISQYGVDGIARRADAGDPLAEYALGFMYEFGVGVPLDLVLARRYLERAAQNGSATGMLEFAYFLERHPASADDRTRALELYQAAADTGYAKAQGHLASVLISGNLVPKTDENVAKAIALMRKSADGGYSWATYSLARMAQGEEYARLIEQLRSLAANGNPDAEQWLCALAMKRGDYAEALPHCQTAADTGLSAAQAHMAIAYHDGLGVALSTDLARHWTRRALTLSWLEPDLRRTLEGFGYNFAAIPGSQ